MLLSVTATLPSLATQAASAAEDVADPAGAEEVAVPLLLPAGESINCATTDYACAITQKWPFTDKPILFAVFAHKKIVLDTCFLPFLIEPSGATKRYL